jgi:hypothetical protein
VTPKSRRKGSFCLLFHLFTLPHTNWNTKIFVAVVLMFLNPGYM